jgi:hypothetical protein
MFVILFHAWNIFEEKEKDKMTRSGNGTASTEIRILGF